jgi:hypothetical protein
MAHITKGTPNMEKSSSLLKNDTGKTMSWPTIFKKWPWMLKVCGEGLIDGYNGSSFRAWYETAETGVQGNYELMRLIGASIKASGYRLNLDALTSSLVGAYFSFFSALGGVASVPGWGNVFTKKAPPVRLIGKKVTQ